MDHVNVVDDERDHAMDGQRLRVALAELTHDYTPPEWACLTFRDLYYGLAALEREMHVHVHLENNILFPPAVSMAAR